MSAWIFACLSLWLLSIAVVGSPLVIQLGDAASQFALDDVQVRVPVVLGVMSRCPDAILCESVFNQVLKNVGRIMDLSLTFVGLINASEPHYGVTCKHGPDECAGNIQQLCAAKHVPTLWWEFVQCQNFYGPEEIGKPELALQCAKATGINWESSGVGQCTGQYGKGMEGIHMLQESVNATRALRIKKSCTVVINGKQVCIHDGSWKQCEDGHSPEDFIRQINDEYERLNSGVQKTKETF